jgi:hypothetical protein
MATLMGGCSGFHRFAGELNQLSQLQRKLVEYTGQSEIAVNLMNGQYLSVSFVNSPLAKLPPDKEKAKALEVAQFIYRNWPNPTQLSKIIVVFEIRYDLVIFHYDNSLDNFEFSPSQLRLSERSASPPTGSA